MKLYLTKLLAFYVGCAGCYLLQTGAGLSAVLSSALLGFTASFLPLPSASNRNGILAALYTGTFAGMSSPELISGHAHVLVVSVFGAAVYLLLKPYLQGVGGKMGAVAFISSILLLFYKVFA